MISASRDLICLAIVLVLATGCMHNPYVNRTVVTEDEEKVEKFFVYGNFCGAGHPELISSDQGRARWADLSTLPPPIDDLDQACFLHDRCHQTRYPEVWVCDWVFFLILDIALEESADERCGNLMYDMSSAMVTRVTSNGTTHADSTLSHFEDAGWVILRRVWREFTNKTDEFPEEETCFFPPPTLDDSESENLVERLERLIEEGEVAGQLVGDPEGVPQLTPLE